jgi:hypothetical protein
VIVATNIGRIHGVPGSHHPQFLDVLHRSHATVEDRVRTNKAMGLTNLPSQSWTVNQGWVLAANIAADLAAWTRLLGLYDQPELAHAEPRHPALPAAAPARETRRPRPPANLDHPRYLALGRGIPALLATPRPASLDHLTRPYRSCQQKETVPGQETRRVRSDTRPTRTHQRRTKRSNRNGLPGIKTL